MTAFLLTPGVPIGVEVRRIATEQVTLALEDLERVDRDEGIHEVRKRCKKVRALLRLVRAADEDLYRRENATFRDVARQLSEVRDTAAVVESFDAAVAALAEGEGRDTYDAVRAGLMARGDARPEPLDGCITAVRADLAAALRRIDVWSVPAGDHELLRAGLRRGYAQSRRRMADAVALGTDEALHEWRKRANHHRHHVRLVERAWPAVLRPYRAELRTLTETLGHDHDLAVLRAIVDDAPDEHGGAALVGRFVARLEHRRGQLQREAQALGARCFAERPGAFADRVTGLWRQTAAAR